MWWMTQVIHYTIISRVNWFLDLATSLCHLPWLTDTFPSLFHRQSEFTMQTFREAQFPLICNILFVFLWALIMCIISRKWSNKVLLDLTWLDFHPYLCTILIEFGLRIFRSFDYSISIWRQIQIRSKTLHDDSKWPYTTLDPCMSTIYTKLGSPGRHSKFCCNRQQNLENKQF